MAKKQNIFLVGPMGAGKTTIGRQLAKQMGRSFYDTDVLIEERSGADISWIFDIEGEDGFRQREKKILQEISQEQDIVLATGGGIIIDDENRNILAARGVVVYLRASLDQQFERTKRDTKRPLLQTDNLQERLHSLHEIREPLYNEIADMVFDTQSVSVRQLTQQIVDQLSSIAI